MNIAKTTEGGNSATETQNNQQFVVICNNPIIYKVVQGTAWPPHLNLYTCAAAQLSSGSSGSSAAVAPIIHHKGTAGVNRATMGHSLAPVARRLTIGAPLRRCVILHATRSSLQGQAAAAEQHDHAGTLLHSAAHRSAAATAERR